MRFSEKSFNRAIVYLCKIPVGELPEKRDQRFRGKFGADSQELRIEINKLTELLCSNGPMANEELLDAYHRSMAGVLETYPYLSKRTQNRLFSIYYWAWR